VMHHTLVNYIRPARDRDLLARVFPASSGREETQ